MTSSRLLNSVAWVVDDVQAGVFSESASSISKAVRSRRALPRVVAFCTPRALGGLRVAGSTVSYGDNNKCTVYVPMHPRHVWYRGEAPQPETGRRTATRWLLIRSYCTLRATKVALDCLYCLLQRRRPNGAGAAVFRPKGLFAFSLLLSLLFRGGLKAVVYRGRRRKHDGRVRSSLYSKPKRARFAELTVLSPPDRKVSQGFESGLQRSLGLTHGRGRCQRFGLPRIFG